MIEFTKDLTINLELSRNRLLFTVHRLPSFPRLPIDYILSPNPSGLLSPVSLSPFTRYSPFHSYFKASTGLARAAFND